MTVVVSLGIIPVIDLNDINKIKLVHCLKTIYVSHNDDENCEGGKNYWYLLRGKHPIIE